MLEPSFPKTVPAFSSFNVEKRLFSIFPAPKLVRLNTFS